MFSVQLHIAFPSLLNNKDHRWTGLSRTQTHSDLTQLLRRQTVLWSADSHTHTNTHTDTQRAHTVPPDSSARPEPALCTQTHPYETGVLSMSVVLLLGKQRVSQRYSHLQCVSAVMECHYVSFF